jgi:hypothetical protein
MSLREALRAAVGAGVARCAPHSTQRATLEATAATQGATLAQQAAGSPGLSSLSSATVDATGAQLGCCAEPSLSPKVSLDTDISSINRIRSRLVRWGWREDEAIATARRIASRSFDDDRRMCIECRHHQHARCNEHRRAGLDSPPVGRDLAVLPQRCPAFKPDE